MQSRHVNRQRLVPVFPGLSQCVEAFDVVLKGPVSEYLNNSRAIGSEVEKHVSRVDSFTKMSVNSVLLLFSRKNPERREELIKMLIDS